MDADPQVVQLTWNELENLFRSSGWCDPQRAKELVAEGRKQAAADIRCHATNILAMACADAGIEPTADAAQEHPLVLGFEMAARIAEEDGR